MAEVVTYEGHAGLMAIAHALNDVRQKLQDGAIEPEHAAGILGCMNMHLSQLIGADDAFIRELQECAGLLCPECSGYLGLVSDLSSCCYHCGERFLQAGDEGARSPGEKPAAASAHMAQHIVKPHLDH
jgi:hypothetical protein